MPRKTLPFMDNHVQHPVGNWGHECHEFYRGRRAEEQRHIRPRKVTSPPREPMSEEEQREEMIARMRRVKANLRDQGLAVRITMNGEEL